MLLRYMYPRFTPPSGLISISYCIFANFSSLLIFLLVNSSSHPNTLPTSPSFCMASQSFLSKSSRTEVLLFAGCLFWDLNLSLNSLQTLRASSREAGLGSLKFLRKRCAFTKVLQSSLGSSLQERQRRQQALAKVLSLRSAFWQASMHGQQLPILKWLMARLVQAFSLSGLSASTYWEQSQMAIGKLPRLNSSLPRSLREVECSLM